MSYLNSDAVPIGFGMGLAQNINAMKHFSGMTEAEKEEILNRARDAKSKKEMDDLISSLNPMPGATGTAEDNSFF